MKRKLFLLLCALLTMIGVQAVEWSGNAPTAGDFYLYNVKSGKFLHFGCNYGTRVCLVDGAGAIVTLTPSNENFKLTFSELSGKDKNGMFVNGSSVPFVDGDAAEFTFTETSAGSKTYTISNGTKYLACRADFSAEPSPLETVDDASSDRATWKIVSRQDRIDALASATKENPVDATFYIRGAEIDQFFNNAGVWDGNDPTYGGRTGNLEATGYAAENYWGQNASSYQDLTSLVNGRYVVSCYGFYRDGAWNEVAAKHNAGTEVIGAHLFANSESTPLSSIMDGAANSGGDGGQEAESGKWIPDAMDQAVLYFFRGRYPAVEVEVNVADGNLRIGVSKDAGTAEKWTIWDRFRLKYLGPTIESRAIALPAGGAMSADTWYYYDIPTSDDYEFTSSAVTTLTYTAEGTQLISEATGTDEAFTAGQKKDIALTNGRLYFKTSAATTLNVSYKYNVGSATVDKEYIQPGNTVTVTWADASTNNPSAEFAKNGTPNITLGGETITITPTENGFSFIVPEIATSASYSLSIPADAFGYAAGATYNAAQEFTLKTPAVYDGTYFLTTTVSEKTKYLSRMTSNDASVDNFGLGFNLTTDKDGVSYIQFLENDNYYLDDNNNYAVATKTKRGANTNKWVIVAVAGGYKVRLQANTNCELTVANTTTGKVEITHGTQNGYVWNFITPEAHETAMQAWVDAQAATAASAAGISATTKAALETAISGYEALAIALPEGYNVSGVQDKFQAGGDLFAEKTLTGLTNGLYKLSLYGYQRISSNDITYAAYGDNAGIGVEYLQANGQQTRMMSVMDVASDTPWKEGNDYQGENGKYYPNNTTGAKAAFDAGNYANDVYVYVSDGTLSYKLYNPSNPVCENWCPYYTFSLTLYSDGMPDVDISTLAAEPMNAETKTALSNAATTYDGSKTTANYSALQTAIFNAEASVVVYETIDAAINGAAAKYRISNLTAAGQEEWNSQVEDIRGKYNAGTYANLSEAESDLYDACIAALSAQGAGSDWTSIITNPSFEDDPWNKGWNVARNTTGTWDYKSLPTSGETAAAGLLDGSRILNAWAQQINYINVTQTMTLPKGRYRLTASAYSDKIKDQKLKAMMGEEELAAGAILDGNTWQTLSVEFDVNADNSVVTLGIYSKGNNLNNDSYGWFRADNFHLTYLGNASANLTVSNGKLGTFIAPFNITLPEKVKAYSATVDGTTVKLAKVAEGDETLDAGTPVIVYGDDADVNVTFYGNASVTENQKVGALVGILKESDKTVPEGSYVLQTQETVQAFYKVAADAPGVLNRCYLNTGVISPARLIISFDEEDPTAINAIEAVESNDGALKDGKYLIGNKVVLVKNGVKYDANGKKLN